MPYALGPGDLYERQTLREENAQEKWLSEASREDLIRARICPGCRSKGCEECAWTGDIVVCQVCGDILTPGTESRIPVNPDQPNGVVDELCSVCATAQ